MGLTREQWKEIDRLMEDMGRTGENYIREGHEHTTQIFTLMWQPKLRVHTVALVPHTRDEKDAAAHAIGALVAPFDAYIFLSEAWRSMAHSEEEVERIWREGSAAQPDRVEVFTLHFVTKLGDQARWEWDIDRTGDKPTLINRTIVRGQADEGRFANFYEYSMPADSTGRAH